MCRSGEEEKGQRCAVWEDGCVECGAEEGFVGEDSKRAYVELELEVGECAE